MGADRLCRSGFSGLAHHGRCAGNLISFHHFVILKYPESFPPTSLCSACKRTPHFASQKCPVFVSFSTFENRGMKISRQQVRLLIHPQPPSRIKIVTPTPKPPGLKLRLRSLHHLQEQLSRIPTTSKRVKNRDQPFDLQMPKSPSTRLRKSSRRRFPKTSNGSSKSSRSMDLQISIHCRKVLRM